MEIKRVGVVGSGLMGSGISQVCAQAKYDVIISDLAQEIVDKGLGKTKKVLNKMVTRGEMKKEDADNIVGRIIGTTDLNDLRDCDLVIEAIIEKLEPKKELFGRLDKICKPDAILSSNTSALSIIDMAAETRRMEKVLGIHFIAPPYMFPVVELVKSIVTSDEVIEIAKKFCDSLDMTPFVTKDYPGFVMNNIQIPMLLQAVRVLDKGLATKEEIDMVMTKGMGHRIGPLALLDYMGLDIALNQANAVYEENRDPVWAPPLLLKKMVTAGWLGRKTGKGFYEY